MAKVINIDCKAGRKAREKQQSEIRRESQRRTLELLAQIRAYRTTIARTA